MTEEAFRLEWGSMEKEWRRRQQPLLSVSLSRQAHLPILSDGDLLKVRDFGRSDPAALLEM